MRSAVFASVASILIASMLLGSVLISNVYAKGSGSEKSKYNLEESCNDTVKGKQITILGTRDKEHEVTTTDAEANLDKDVNQGTRVDTAPPANSGIPAGDSDFLFNQENHKNHFELPPSPTVVLKNGTQTKVPVNTIGDQRIRDTLEYTKTLPLKERRVFNVCGLPIGNAVDGFQFNEVDGTKKSDILLGTGAADDIHGKGGGDVIQARDDDDIVHGGSGDDSIQGGFGNDNIHADDGDDAVFAGPNDDYLNGGKGNDELYAQDGDDTLEGGPGADFFDCGPGFDVVVDFNPSEGDVTNDNCEDVRTVL
jgi:Ca2+-binding RTX toxin-like protein